MLTLWVAAFLMMGVVPGSGPAAQAIDPSRGLPGYCPDSSGVTVVVDFQQIGSREVVVRCAPNVDASSTGLDAFYDAGFQIEGTRRWGEGFICRIENAPAPGEEIPVQGDPTYREPCIDTPPALAYWSYWHAPDGGSWEYSSFGVKNRTIIPGGFEGWSFALNATESSNPPPRVSPQRPPVSTPTDPPSVTPTATPTATPAPAPEPAPAPSPAPTTTTAISPTTTAAEPADSTPAPPQSQGQPEDEEEPHPTSGEVDEAGEPTEGDSQDDTNAPAPSEAHPDAGDQALSQATTGPADAEVVISGGEHLVDQHDQGAGASLFGIPVTLWFTVLAILALLTGGAIIARRRGAGTLS